MKHSDLLSEAQAAFALACEAEGRTGGRRPMTSGSPGWGSSGARGSWPSGRPRGGPA